MPPTHLHLFWTYSGSKLSKLTRSATGGDQWTHTGMFFVFPDGSNEAFEARSKSGWTGPYDFRDTIKYVEDMGGEYLVSEPLPITDSSIAEAYDTAVAQLKTKRYPRWQLVNYYLHKGHPWIPMIKSPNALICSEGVARCISGKECIGALPPLKTYDEPDGLSPMDVFHDHAEMIAASNNWTANTGDSGQ